jgi:hypothetical protein
LALERLVPHTGVPEVRSALCDLLKRGVDAEVLRRILLLYPHPEADLAAALSRSAPRLDAAAAELAIRWLRGASYRVASLLTPFLDHPDPRVDAWALSGWPPGNRPDPVRLARLLASEDEALLIALLRLLKREGPPAVLCTRIGALRESSSPAVRAWAALLTRD